MPSDALISRPLTLDVVPLAFYQLATFLHEPGHNFMQEKEA